MGLSKVLIYYCDRGQYNMLDTQMYQILHHQVHHIHEFEICLFLMHKHQKEWNI